VTGPFPYLRDDLDQSAPGCVVTVSYDAHSRDWPAIFDTGADLTSIPIDLVNEFSLKPEGEVEVFGATADGGEEDYDQQEPEIQGLYFVNLEFAQIPTMTVAAHPVLGGTGRAAREYVLIGRDILNRHTILLAGPRREFTVD